MDWAGRHADGRAAETSTKSEGIGYRQCLRCGPSTGTERSRYGEEEIDFTVFIHLVPFRFLNTEQDS